MSLMLDVVCAIFKITTFLVATLFSRRCMGADALGLVDKTSLIKPHFLKLKCLFQARKLNGHVGVSICIY